MRVFIPLLKIILFLTVSMATVGFAFGAEKSGASFLKVPIGARAVGLGNAYTSMANGVDGLNWNVAGIARSEDKLGFPTGGLTFSHLEFIEDSTLDNFGLIAPIKSLGNTTFVGLSVTRMGYAEQERRGTNREKQGSFESQDLVAGLSLAQYWSGVQLGSQIKMIRQDIDNQSAQGFALDLGVMKQLSRHPVSLGLSVRNLGPKMRFIEAEFNLPLTISAGSSYKVMNSFSISLDAHSRPHQDQFFFSLGSELVPLSGISLRAGYLAKVAEGITNNQKSESNRGEFEGFNGMTGGFGLKLGQFDLDYAFTPMGEQGNTQILTLSMKFR